MKHLTLRNSTIDWKLLRGQKETLYNEVLAGGDTMEDLQGILNLIDYIQDQAVVSNSFSSLEVFNIAETVTCTIQFKDDDATELVEIGIAEFDEENLPINDDDIVYYVPIVNELYTLLDVNVNDFVVIPQPKKFITLQPMIGHEEVAWRCDDHPSTYETLAIAQARIEEDWKDTLELHPDEHGDNKDFVGYCKKISDDIYFIYDIDDNYLFTHNAAKHR